MLHSSTALISRDPGRRPGPPRPHPSGDLVLPMRPQRRKPSMNGPPTLPEDRPRAAGAAACGCSSAPAPCPGRRHGHGGRRPASRTPPPARTRPARPTATTTRCGPTARGRPASPSAPPATVLHHLERHRRLRRRRRLAARQQPDRELQRQHQRRPAAPRWLSLYGWSTNPLVEYYVIENYGRLPAHAGTFMGTVTSDGGTYNIYEHQQVNQPSIQGTATFNQYLAIRQSQRPPAGPSPRRTSSTRGPATA